MFSFRFLSLALLCCAATAANASPSTNATFIALEISQISPCGMQCLGQTLPVVGCAATDIECQCASSKLLPITAECMQEHCTVAESLELAQIQSAICQFKYETRNPLLRATTIATTVITNTAVLLRYAIRGFLQRTFGWDDGFMIVAAVSQAVFVYYGTRLEQNGFGNHIWFVNLSDVGQLLQWFYNCEIIYVLTIGLVKVSILFFYLQVFPKQSFRLMVWLTMAFCLATCIAFTLVTIFQCHPISFAWDKTLHGKCVNYNNVSWVHAGINILQDIIIVVLPITELWHIQLSPKKKIRLFIMFGLGFFVCITSIVRLYSLKTFGLTNDPTWDNVPTTFWSTLETCAAIVCACLPTIRAGIVRFFPKFLETTIRHNTKHSQITASHDRPTRTTETSDPAPKNWPAVELTSFSSSFEQSRSSNNNNYLTEKELPPLPALCDRTYTPTPPTTPGMLPDSIYRRKEQDR